MFLDLIFGRFDIGTFSRIGICLKGGHLTIRANFHQFDLIWARK